MCNICKYATLEGDTYYCSYKNKYVYKECDNFEADEDYLKDNESEEK